MTTLTRADWEQRAKNLQIEGRALIHGEHRDAVSGQTFECVSPVDGRVLGLIASCDAADADVAVRDARATFESGVWSRMKPVERKKIMIRFADLLDAHAEELALLETLDMGKPIAFSLSVDVAGASRAIRWSGEAIDKIYDEVAATPHDELGLVTREPVGVVAAIVPWNFPMIMTAWKLGPALATGNSVIVKPSEKSPLTAIRMAELALEAGIPAGVLNVLPGFGHTVGKALALHMDVDTLVFTGSTKIAKQLMIYAGESNMKRVWLEAGGKSANIVFADAPNLQDAAEAAAGLGVNTTLVRTAALGAATLLCAAATAAVGPIAFVGLAVPHIVRALVGLDMRRQLLGCLLVGPIVLLGADVVGRVVLRPQELMVGVVTAFVGAPILLLAVRRLGRKAQA